MDGIGDYINIQRLVDESLFLSMYVIFHSNTEHI